jgi:hypothetical protein
MTIRRRQPWPQKEELRRKLLPKLKQAEARFE